MAKWDGYPPDPTKDGWWWIAQETYMSPCHWSAEQQEWSQGGFICGGTAPAKFFSSDHFTGGLRLVGPCPEPKE